MEPYQIILRPLQSEKTTALYEKSVYVFQVHQKANKLQIMSALTELFGVTPLKCRIVNLPSKPKRVRNIAGKTARKKKAYVSLPPDQTLPFLEGVRSGDKR